MTTKMLSGTYSAGYTIHSPVNVLSVTASGYVEGSGIGSPSGATAAYTIANRGRVVAAAQATGVYLGEGGVVTNGGAAATSALISGYRGVAIHNGSGAVANFGTIVGTARSAVYLAYGGVVRNGSASILAASIRGSNGVVIHYSLAERAGTVVNFGAIAGFATASGQAGVYLGSGEANGGVGVVANGSLADQTATITGYSGVVAEGNGSITNFGSIIGLGVDAGSGVYLRSNGEIINGASGQSHAVIRGLTGVILGYASATLTNFGTISGAGGTAVKLEGSGNALVVEAGCAFDGAVLGGGGLLDLASGGGTLSRLAAGGVVVSGSMATTSFTNFGVVEVGASAAFALVGGGSILAGQTLSIMGALNESGSLANAGLISVAGEGQLSIHGVETDPGSGRIEVAAGGIVQLQGELGGAGDSVLFDAGSTLTGSGVIASSSFMDNGAIVAAGGNLTLSGSGSSIAGGVSGDGALVFKGGSQRVLAGASFAIADWSVLSGATTTVNTNLTYAGAFRLGGASLGVSRGAALSLSGPATFGLGALINSAGVVAVSQAAVSGLTIGGTATLKVDGTLTQTGAIVIGDGTAAAARGSISAGGVWRIAGGVGLGRGASDGSRLIDSGLLIKSGGKGISAVGVAVSDYGVVEVASGTLDFTQSTYGSGALKIDAGATLELDGVVSSVLTLTFAGSDGRLALGRPAGFRVSITGFAASDSIDLLSVAATSATLASGDKLIVKNGARTVATLQLVGDYAGDSFAVAGDGRGGSAITLSGSSASRAVRNFAQQAASTAAASSPSATLVSLDAANAALSVLASPKPRV